MIAAMICVVTIALAQQPAAPKRPLKAPAPKLKLAPGAPDQGLVLQMLEASAAEVQGLRDPGLRAYLLLQTAQSYKQADSAKVAPTLADAFRATLEIDGQKFQDGQTKIQLQNWTMEQLRTADAAQADEFVPQAEPLVQRSDLSRRLSQAIKSKQFDRAAEMLDTLAAQSPGFPYYAAAQLMVALPKEADDLRQRAFSQAIPGYSREEHTPLQSLQGDSFGTLIVRFWRQLPPGLVLQAIDTLLSTSKEIKNPQGIRLTLGSPAGSVSFNSDYEGQLFLVLPVLKELDPQRAQKLLEENAEERDVLAKYPAGLQTLDPTYRETPLKDGERSQLWGMFQTSRSPASTAGARASSEWANLAATIVKDAPGNPREALARAMALPVSSDAFINPRPDALAGIADALKKTNEPVAKEAAEKLIETAMGLEDAVTRAQYLAKAAKLLIELNETQAANKAIAEGMKTAEKRYAIDTDRDHPNYAMKAYFPSVAIWRKFITLAAEISPATALEAVQQISDKEIQACLRSALVSQWLGANLLWAGAIEVDKDGRQRLFTHIE
jgi:hypothetical protein